MKHTTLYQSIFFASVFFASCSNGTGIFQLREDLKSDNPEIRRNAAMEISSHMGAISPDKICSDRGTCIPLDSASAEILGNELIGCLSDTNAWVRINAIRGLADLKFEKASPFVIEKLNDPDGIAKESAIRALAVLGDKTAVPVLIKMLEESSAKEEGNTEDIMRTLGAIGDKSATPSIIACLKETDNTRWLCAGLEALGNLKDERGSAVINSNINHPNDFVRSTAVQALANLESERAIPGLLNALYSFDLAKNTEAAEILAEYGAKVLDQLLSAAKDENIPRRSGAIYAIGLTGDENSLDFLLEKLKDENDIVKISAMCALENEKYREKGINPLIDISKNNSGLTGLLADMLLCEAFNPSWFFSDHYDRLALLRLNSFDDRELTYGAVSFSHESKSDMSFAIPFLINMLGNNTDLLWVPEGETTTSENAKPTTPAEEAYKALQQRALKYKDARDLQKDKGVWENWWKKHENEYRQKLQKFWQNQMAGKSVS